MTEIEQSGVRVEEEVETGIQNGSDSGTKISDEENDYLFITIPGVLLLSVVFIKFTNL